MKLKSFEILESGTRISSVDVFRAIAILSVVIYHFEGYLPYGYLGVDLFFVISGLLVGSILIRQFKRDENVNFIRFFFKRGFKIWPSYYCFLLVGNLLAYVFFNKSRPDYIIQGGRDTLKYIFFYQNYISAPFHRPFSHLWSLCVEEHFYILLPLFFLFIKGLFKNNRKVLIWAVAGLILTGIVFKFFTVKFTPGTDTYSTTHNRIDALAWGALLGILVTYYEEYLKKIKWLSILFFIGVLLFAASIFTLIQLKSLYFEKAIFFSLSPFCFFLMLLGLYYHDFSKWKPLRFVAYYSYNWYLWHPLLVLIIGKYFGANGMGLVIYMLVSFLMAMVFTILIEERFLAIRETVLNRIFKRTTREAA